MNNNTLESLAVIVLLAALALGVAELITIGIRYAG
jgi:hypothetical protein